MITLLSGALCYAQAPPVPAEYQDLYSSMQASISSFNDSVLALWDGSRPPLTFGAHTETLNANNGSAILDPAYYQLFLAEIRGLKAMGVTGVTLDINFPSLDPNFDAWGGQSDAYLSLYQNAVSDIRAQGMKVIVETGPIFSDPLFSPVNPGPYYNSLSTQAYMNARARQARIIARELQPDYLNVLSEPDTEAAQSGKPELGTYSGSMQLLNTILLGLRRSGNTAKIGAGVGTWLAPDSEGKNIYDFIDGYASTPIDNIDMHVYPVINDFLARMTTIAGVAKKAGKGVTIGECWAYKERSSESGVLTADTISPRDVYSFWAPVDTLFLTAMTNFGFYQNAGYVAPFWSGYFRSYLDYDATTATMPPTDLYDNVRSLQATQMQSGSYSLTGFGYYGLLVIPADVSPPAAPVVTTTVRPTQVVLNWDWPTDNVGVAKFLVSRSGVPPVSTAATTFVDSNLSDGATYSYAVTAFDLAGQLSTTTVTVETPDVTPPTPPTQILATVSGTRSITVTWSGAADNVKVTGYKLYRGVGGVTPSPFAALGAVTTFTNDNVQLNTSYCYYVLAQDATGMVSSPSSTACATVDTVPPTPPASVTANGTTPPVVVVTWQPSTDTVGVAGYNVERIVNQGDAVVVAQGLTKAGYIDSSAVPQPDTAAPFAIVAAPAAGSVVSATVLFDATVWDVGAKTTFSYQVQSYDAAGNLSPWSTTAAITWPAVTSRLAGVRFQVDGLDVAPELTAAPYRIGWNTSSVVNGSHTLTVIARDVAGNTRVSPPVVVTVKN